MCQLHFFFLKNKTRILDRLTVLFAFVMLSFSGYMGNAQSFSSKQTSLPEETLSISISDVLIVSGSSLYFQVVATTGPKQKLSELSKVAEIGFYNAAGEKVLFQKVKLSKGVGSGKFFILPSLPSGEYSLVVATGWSMNNEKHPKFAGESVIILNPFQHLSHVPVEDSIKLEYKTEVFSPPLEDNNKGGLALESIKKSYRKREKVQIEISSSLSFERPVTMAVKRVKPIEIVKTGRDRKIVINADENFIPEVRGDVIHGAIITKDPNLSIANQLITLSIPGKNYVFKVNRTDANGEFIFYLDENEYSYKDIHLHVAGDDQENFQITLNNSITNFIHPEERISNLRVDERLKDWIEFQNAANQIENAYYETKTEKIIDPPLKDPFYYPLGFMYKLDEYKRFPTIIETFVEIIDRAAIRKQGENYVFKTFNYNEEERIDGIDKLHPLILIDGNRIENNNILIDFSVEKIESITVVPDNYRYGSELFAGIIDVATKGGDYIKEEDLKNFNFVYPSPETLLYQPVYPQDNTLSRIPDYRTTLYWNPQINLKNQEVIFKEFYTSDIEGWYEIALNGYNNNGERVEIFNYFKVE